LQNIRRNMADAREAYDPATGNKILRGKPRFVLQDGNLHLRNIPVPAGPMDSRNDPSAANPVTDLPRNNLLKLKSWLNGSVLASAFKWAGYSLIRWEPFPEYRNAQTPEWLLMAAIIHRFKEEARKRPLVVVPVFYESYVLYHMARNYWDRFTSLETEGIQVIDLLPHFKEIGPQAVRAYLSPEDCHFSPYGHVVVADALQMELTRLGLLP